MIAKKIPDSIPFIPNLIHPTLYLAFIIIRNRLLNMKQNILIEMVCFLLILLFVYAALSKLIDYSNFKIQLSRSPLIKASATYLAIILPALELITAGMLMVPSSRIAGLFLAFVVLSLFTFYIIYMLLTEKKLPCSCGGVLKQITWKQHILFNVFFLLIAFAGIKMENKNCCAK
ncbi:MAG: hypothetical protein JWO92_1229 [Chitinophagaceae bacterium]|nr:hypothetical protein [Chitinophagaceae bacterium]